MDDGEYSDGEYSDQFNASLKHSAKTLETKQFPLYTINLRELLENRNVEHYTFKCDPNDKEYLEKKMLFKLQAHLINIMTNVEPELFKKYIKGVKPEETLAMRNFDIKKGNKSFTVDKEHITLCMYDENGNMYPEDILSYVIIHEAAHLCNTSSGHDASFDDTFDLLLAVARKLKIPCRTHENMILNYCGM